VYSHNSGGSYIDNSTTSGNTPKNKGPAANDQIENSEVRLIDDNGTNHGVVKVGDALTMAKSAGLDLVVVSPNVDPPVCKILDFGKFKFDLQKKATVAKKKQRIQSVKEIKMRPSIDIHDYEVKMRSVVKFLEHGDKVKVTMRFRGREMAHQELGMDVLKRVQEDMKEIGKIEAYPKTEGRQMMMVMSPK
jgi:translation initiation factor IF-3